jgi:hypothetical protein
MIRGTVGGAGRGALGDFVAFQIVNNSPNTPRINAENIPTVAV